LRMAALFHLAAHMLGDRFNGSTFLEVAPLQTYDRHLADLFNNQGFAIRWSGHDGNPSGRDIRSLQDFGCLTVVSQTSADRSRSSSPGTDTPGSSCCVAGV